MTLYPISLFAMALAAAGLPLYIHLPRYAELELGMSLSAVGAILIGIRILDFAQDPLLGWLVDRYPNRRRWFVGVAVVGLSFGFLALFSIQPEGDPFWWLVAVLVAIFTAYSLATILFYGQTRALAESGEAKALIRIASWREVGTLGGIIFAAALPALLGYTGFGIALFLLFLIAGWVSRPIWQHPTTSEASLNLSAFLAAGGGWLLTLALVNSLPVAITSTLFVFYVEDALGLTDFSGGFLILFFIAAAVSIPIWSRLSDMFGVRKVLVAAMSLTIASVSWALIIPEGAGWAYAALCIGSGVAVGADLLLLPALFSGVLAQAGLKTGQAFGLWSFANKLALAAAAALVLPILDATGFQSASANSDGSIQTLRILYAVVPCCLKALAIALVLSLPKKAVLQCA